MIKINYFHTCTWVYAKFAVTTEQSAHFKLILYLCFLNVCLSGERLSLKFLHSMISRFIFKISRFHDFFDFTISLQNFFFSRFHDFFSKLHYSMISLFHDFTISLRNFKISDFPFQTFKFYFQKFSNSLQNFTISL